MRWGWSASSYDSFHTTSISCFGEKEMLYVCPIFFLILKSLFFDWKSFFSRIDGQFYKTLQCTEFGGWTDNGNVIKEATDNFAANCVEKGSCMLFFAFDLLRSFLITWFWRFPYFSLPFQLGKNRGRISAANNGASKRVVQMRRREARVTVSGQRFF